MLKRNFNSEEELWLKPWSVLRSTKRLKLRFGAYRVRAVMWVTSMLVTDFGDQMWQNLNNSDRSRHQHHILAYNDVGDRCKSLKICLKMETNLLNLAQGWILCLQHSISPTNITLWHIMMLVTDENVTNMQKNENFAYLPIPITLISKRAFGAWNPYPKENI